MTGPRPAGRPWTQSEDRQLRDMLNARKKAPEIAQKLKRTIGAVHSRVQTLSGRKKAAPLRRQQPAPDRSRRRGGRIVGLPMPALCSRRAPRSQHPRSAPSFAKAGRIHFIDFPIEKLVVAGPRMNLASANLTAETTRMLVWVVLPYGGVRQSAIGAAKIFGRPYATCHPAIMRSIEHVFQPKPSAMINGSLP
jgi:hypothetical protein